MIITISGKQGAGKTTIAKELGEKLEYNFISVGEIQGELASERGMTINEFMELGETDKSIHLEMDKKITEMGKTKDNFIVEGWLAFHFIPHAYKIFLVVDEDVGAERIFKDKRGDEPRQETVEKTKQKLKERLTNVRESFKKYYNIDFLDPSPQDLIIDTTNLKIEQVVKEIMGKIQNGEKNI